MTVPILEDGQLADLDAWLRSILWNSEMPGYQDSPDDLVKNKLEVHRLKAIIPLSNGDIKIVQGVREVFEILDAPESDGSAGSRLSLSHGKIVLIGRYLDRAQLEKSFSHVIEKR